MIAKRVLIRGRVQGVGYRYWVMGEARRRGLDGWVRNRRDGSVEALFAGSDAEVEAMIASCRRGPPAARVTDIQLLRHEALPAPGFQAMPTL